MTADRRAAIPAEPAAVQDQIATLRRRIDEIESGIVTPRRVKDAMLFLCPTCQRIASDVTGTDADELKIRIEEEVKRLEGRRARLERRAS